MNYIRPHVHKQMNTWIVHEYLLYKNRTSNWEGDGCCWLLPLVFDCRCCKIVVVEFVACIVKMLLLRSKIHHSYSDHFQIGLLYKFLTNCFYSTWIVKVKDSRTGALKVGLRTDFEIFEFSRNFQVIVFVMKNNDLTRNEKKIRTMSRNNLKC